MKHDLKHITEENCCEPPFTRWLVSCTCGWMASGKTDVLALLKLANHITEEK
jgi:hypothetical protein